MPSATRNLHKVSRKLIYEDVLSILRAAILDGSFEIGEHLIEAEIAAQLETSRVPVREAFKELAREKLLELHPFKGAVVASFTANDIHEIYTLRCLLEGCAARLVAEQATPEELARLQGMHDEIETLILKNDLGSVPQKDFEFHREICRLSGNERLLEIWDGLASQVRLVIVMADEIFLETYSILEVHRPVMKALMNRDGVGAEESMALNLRKSAKLVVQRLEDMSASDRLKKS